MYLMRVIKFFGTRELILMGVELPWIFLFIYCYCKIASFGPRKVGFWKKKLKDVIHDGTGLLRRRHACTLLFRNCQSTAQEQAPTHMANLLFEFCNNFCTFIVSNLPNCEVCKKVQFNVKTN